MKRTHRKLQINVENIEKQYEKQINSNEQRSIPHENDEQSQELSVQHQPQSQEYEQDNHYADNSYNQDQQQQQSSVKVHQNVETLGNHNYCQNILKSMNVNPQFGSKKPKQAKLSYLLPQTPIDVSNSPKTVLSNYRRVEQSNLEDEVDRIVKKVMKKQKEQSSRPLDVEKYKKQLDKARKIDKINKDLLHQNAQLIGKINELQKKVENLNSKRLNPTKCYKRKDKQIECFDDKQLLKTLKLYRQKIAKALQLNGKLTSRMNTQKSKSQMISQVQRSILNQGEGEKQIGGISTIRSQSIIRDDKNQKSKPLNITQRFKQQEVYCSCCKLLKKNQTVELEKKQASRHPILQMVNDYRISQSGVKVPQMLKKGGQKLLKTNYCQVNLDEESFIQEYQALQNKQKELQVIVDRNNTKIQQYEMYLLKMIEFE